MKHKFPTSHGQTASFSTHSSKALTVKNQTKQLRQIANLNPQIHKMLPGIRNRFKFRYVHSEVSVLYLIISFLHLLALKQPFAQCLKNTWNACNVNFRMHSLLQKMLNLDPQILTPMLEFVHASKIHVFEFNNFNFAFAGVETTFYTMSKNNKTRLKCEFQNAIQKPTKVDSSSPNLRNNVRACVRICATRLRI